jgi:hypothetical protein
MVLEARLCVVESVLLGTFGPEFRSEFSPQTWLLSSCAPEAESSLLMTVLTKAESMVARVDVLAISIWSLRSKGEPAALFRTSTAKFQQAMMMS